MLFKNKNRRSPSKKIIIILAIILIGIAAAGSYFAINHNKSDSKNNNNPEPAVNLNPPTEDEQKAADTVKEKVIEQQKTESSQPPQTNSPNTVKPVKPQITYAGQYGDQIEVGGYVSGIFEDGGTCTLTLVGNNATRSATVTSSKGANSVDCPVMAIKRSELSPGKWTATVTYKSNTASGTSDARAFEVR